MDPQHPLTGVVHTAGVAANAVTGALTPEYLDHVLGPKADAAWYLHELTRDLPLTAFVMFSSSSCVVDGPGQGNYAAANLFLGGLAEHRAALGLPAHALAWGLWGEGHGMVRSLKPVDIERIRRWGMTELTADEGLELFDTAVRRPVPAQLLGASGSDGDPGARRRSSVPAAGVGADGRARRAPWCGPNRGRHRHRPGTLARPAPRRTVGRGP
ncbi:KR domain-containing protein [Streptomyces sp. UP1A-1]|nr:KR domain-containing protein [Streptomyces sp. UP1A-1]